MSNHRLEKELKLTLLVAIEAIFCFTPLGSIPIGPIVATLAHIPVITTSIAYGWKRGCFMGLMMAIFSFIVWTFVMPAHPLAFLFTPFSESAGYKGNYFSIIICFIPRILMGIIPSFICEHVKFCIVSIREMVASFCGSMVNTILVLLLAFIFFGKEYSTISGQSVQVILGMTIVTNGIPEAIAAAIICPILATVIKILGYEK